MKHLRESIFDPDFDGDITIFSELSNGKIMNANFVPSFDEYYRASMGYEIATNDTRSSGEILKDSFLRICKKSLSRTSALSALNKGNCIATVGGSDEHIVLTLAAKPDPTSKEDRTRVVVLGIEVGWWRNTSPVRVWIESRSGIHRQTRYPMQYYTVSKDDYIKIAEIIMKHATKYQQTENWAESRIKDGISKIKKG